MDLLDDFLAQYAKEFDYYDQVARLAARKVEGALQSEGIRAIVTSRAKSINRLGDKLKKRNVRSQYSSIEAIYEDIVDLAGVRIALYFPGEREKVGTLITRLFDCHQEKAFPAAGTDSSKVFSGYAATHYRARLRSSELDEPERRYATANIEFQVASVLMHAWSEVEHDLVYKPFEGELSVVEYSLLDQLNGLVLAGEISLQQLQRAGEARVAEGDRSFSNHYELAAHLLSSASEISADEVTDQGLGRVDLLYALLAKLKIGTPNDLSQYLKLLHGDLELRPLSDQIIDAILTEDASRWPDFLEVRQEIEALASGIASGWAAYAESGLFIEKWAELEKLLRDLMPGALRIRTPSLLARELQDAEVIGPETRREIERLSRFRNAFVHGMERFTPVQLADISKRVVHVIGELQDKNSKLIG